MTPGLLVYCQKGSESKYSYPNEPSPLDNVNKADESDMEDDDDPREKAHWVNKNIHIPSSRQFTIYYFLRSQNQSR